MSHPNEPSLKRLAKIKEELQAETPASDDYANKLLVINAQIRRKEKEQLAEEKEVSDGKKA